MSRGGRITAMVLGLSLFIGVVAWGACTLVGQERIWPGVLFAGLICLPANVAIARLWDRIR